MKLGGKDVLAAYLGERPVQAMYLGAEQVWSGEVPAIYYVDATLGDNDANGLSPATAWQTLDKVSATTFSPGDSILLKAGEAFYEHLFIRGSGTEIAPITIDRYGEGDDPILYGSEIQESWTKTSGRTNVYEAPLANDYKEVAKIQANLWGVLYWHVWVTNAVGPYYLTAADDVADCDATAGSCYYDSVAEIMYIHPLGSTNPNTDGDEYRIPVLHTCLSMANPDAHTDYIHAKNLDIRYPGRYGVQDMYDLGSDDTKLCIHTEYTGLTVSHTRHDGITAVNTCTIRECTVNNCRANGAFVMTKFYNDERWPWEQDIKLFDCKYVGGAVTNPEQLPSGAVHLHFYIHDVVVDGFESTGPVQAHITTTSNADDNSNPKDITIKNMVADGFCRNAINLRSPTENIVIENFDLQTSHSFQHAIRLEDTDQQEFVVRDSIFRGTGASDGILIDLGGTTNAVFERVVADGYARAFRQRDVASSGTVLDHCTIVNSTQRGVSIEGFGLLFQTDIQVTCCVFEGNDRHVALSGGDNYSDLTFDYNLYHDAGTSEFLVGATNGTLAQWKAGVSQDPNSANGDPLLNADYEPQEGSAAIGFCSDDSTVGAKEPVE